MLRMAQWFRRRMWSERQRPRRDVEVAVVHKNPNFQRGWHSPASTGARMQNPTNDLKLAGTPIAQRDGTGNSLAEHVSATGKPVPVLDAFTDVAPLDAFTDDAPLEEPCEFFTDWQLPNPIRKPSTGR